MSKKVLSIFVLLSSIAFSLNSYAMEQSPRGIQPGNSVSNIKPRQEYLNGVSSNFLYSNMFDYLLHQSNPSAITHSNSIKELYSKLIYSSDLKLGEILERIKVDFEKFEEMLKINIGINEYTKQILNKLRENISDEIFEEFREKLIDDLNYEDDEEIIRKRLEENGFRVEEID